jgi:hypothetical protein
MSTSLIGSIDLNKIDKSKVKEVKLKDGSVAKFYDIKVVLKDEADQYGQSGFICQGQTKEEREAKADTIYLGNLKKLDYTKKEEESDDLPF